MLPSTVRSLLSALVVPLAMIALASTAAAQCEPQWQAGDPVVTPLGEVAATLVWDPDGAGPATSVLVAGGNFTVGSMVSVPIATYDGTQWSPLGTPPAGTVSALTLWNGQLVAAIGGIPGAMAVITWNGSAWQSLGSISSAVNFALPIRAMAVFQGSLVVAGLFHSIGGVAANNIARWDGAAWSPLGAGVSGDARALAVFSGVLYVGGDLTAAGGLSVGNLATWNGSVWAATQRLNRPVNKLATRIGQGIADSHLFAGGEFWIIGTGPGAITAHSVARYNASTNAWTAMGTTLNGSPCRGLFVRSFGISSYEVVAGVINQTPIRRWDGTTWQPLGSLGSGQPPTTFTYFAGQYVAGLPNPRAILKLVSGTWQTLTTPGFVGQVFATLDHGNDVVIGGLITIAGVPMNGIARGTSNAWSPLGTGVTGTNGLVCALAKMPNGDLVAGGVFTVGGGGAGNYIARWNGTTWSPLGSGLDGTVRALLAMPNGDLIAGGSFLTAGGNSAPYVARWNGSAWSSMAAGMNGEVHALVRMPNGDVVAGGEFTLAGSILGYANRVARWNGSTWSPLGGGVDAGVRALALLPNGELMVGGPFQFAAGLWTPSLARWNGSVWAAVPAGSQTQQVSSLAALPNGDLVVGGDTLLRITGNSVTTLPIGGGGVDAVTTTRSGDLLVGGDFATAGSMASANFARLVPPCAATVVPDGAGCTGSAGPVVFTATDLPWLGGTYRATATGIAAGAVAFDVLGLQATSQPLSLIHPAGGAGCNNLVMAIAVRFLVPSNGTATMQLVVPADPAFLGMPLFDQVQQVEIGASQAITAITSSNGLRLTIGTL